MIGIDHSPEGCCAIREIFRLNTYEDAEKAMHDLLKKHYNHYSKKLADLGAFVLFSTVEKINKLPYDDEDCMEDYDYKATIGRDFAKLIVRHRLGVVKDCGRRYNRLCHENHLVHVWMWLPTPKNCEQWWEKKELESGNAGH